MLRSTFALAAAVAALTLASSVSLQAAELSAPIHRHYVRGPAYCGRCGCLGVRYVRHRVLESTYGASFDPRNYDTTEPYYFFGPIRAFPRYFVYGVPASDQCWSR